MSANSTQHFPFSITKSVGSRRKLVANSIHIARRRDADATQLDSWVASASAVCIGINAQSEYVEQSSRLHSRHHKSRYNLRLMTLEGINDRWRLTLSFLNCVDGIFFYLSASGQLHFRSGLMWSVSINAFMNYTTLTECKTLLGRHLEFFQKALFRPKSLLLDCQIWWRSIQHNNTTPQVRFLFFWNFTIGQTGSSMFCRISQNCEEVFRLKFLYRQGGHPALFWNKQKGGGFLDESWHFWPLEIGGVGDKHLTTPTTPSVKIS